MPTYYDVDLRHAKLREFAFSTPLVLMPIIALFKLFRFRFPGTTDDPPVEKLAPFEVDQAELPADIRAKFVPLARELAALGFGRPIYHSIPYSLHATRSYWATCIHSSGTTWARIHCRIWSGEGKDKVHLFPIFFTEFYDDSFLITSGGKPDMIMPAQTRMVNLPGASALALWKRHVVEHERDLRLTARRVNSPQEVRLAMERLHAVIRDYLLDRGIFQPLSDAEQQRLQGTVTKPESADEGIASAESLRRAGRTSEPAPHPADPEEAAVMLELERLQNTKASWVSMLLVLIVSALLFVGAGRMGQGQEMLWTIIPILFFHEMGHYLAMRWFGYRNLKMFFIPFFGAAVSGRHYNVPGWKKVIVALAGPVPGIVVGGILGGVALAFNQPWLVHAAMFTVILNGFNLLPLLPLDGGHVLHAVLFSRHPVLDVVFRFVAIVALFALGLWAEEWVLYVLPGIMLISLPVSWRLANVAHELRKEGMWSVSQDDQTIPFEAAHHIYVALRTALPTMKMPRMIAQHIAQVFETVNARPPGLGASIALLAAHGVSFFASLFLAAVLMMGGNWWMLGNDGMRPIPPEVKAEKDRPDPR